MNCPVCNVVIPEERVDYLRGLRYPDHDIFCVKHASQRTIKAIYSGEPGTSELIFCKHVYNDSVHSTLINAEECEDDFVDANDSPQDTED